MRQAIFLCIIFFLFTCFGSFCSAGDKPSVFVSILPQKYFVEQIAGDLVDVHVMVKPGASPATYEPKVSQMKKLSSCEIYFAIGVPFERAWLGRIAGVNPQMRIVRTDAGIEKRSMEKHLHEQKGHAADEGHHHEESERVEEDGFDPHIWLSPVLVKQQAALIAASLKELLPEQATHLENNLAGFQKQLDALDAELHQILAGKKGLRFMVFHPSWGYFAWNYGIEQIPIEIEGKGPKSSQLRELILFARAEGIKVIFAQPQFSSKSAGLVAREIDGQVISIDPLAEDWLANMKVVAKKFRDAIQ